MAELVTINNATSGEITLTHTAVAISGTTTQFAEALDGTINYTGDVTVTGTYTAAQLASINTGTTGSLTIDDPTVNLSGTSSDLAAAFTASSNGTPVTTHTGTIGITNSNYTISELKTINDGSTGNITFTTTNTALSGSSSDLATALANSNNYAGTVTVTNADYTVANLKVINDGTSGEIVLNNTSVALSGTSSDLADVFAGTITTHTAAITVTNSNHTLAHLKAINNGSTGTITLADYSVALSGTSADVAAALDGTFASTYTGDVSLNNSHTLSELKTINNGTNGSITLTDYTVALSGATADIKQALAGTLASTYTGNVTLSDANGTPIAATDITTIDGDTNGTITVSNNINMTGSAEEINAAVAVLDTISGAPTATLNTAHTLAPVSYTHLTLPTNREV